MEISDLEFDMANMRGMKPQLGPYATSARYDEEHDAIVVVLNNGSFIGFPVEKLQGLQGANASQLTTSLSRPRVLGFTGRISMAISMFQL
ncbi:hypothetical protein [Ensifer sp. MJa1]|uniref:hypothetical protein n=1 Tax=Ensifer sp. MJa1 TaxID=2919888 RepID=UPI003008D5DB